MSLTPVELRVQNLRNYYDATLGIDRATTVVVGPNNAGKTSVLRIFDWLFRTPVDSFVPYRELDKEDEAFLLPARESRHKARRLTVTIRVSDGRQHRTFECENGNATLRLNIRLTPRPLAYLSLGPAQRSEKSETTEKASRLLAQLLSEIDFGYIPAFRDAGSARFRNTLDTLLLNRIRAKASHHSQGGAPTEYRKIRSALATAKGVIEGLLVDFWPETKVELPTGMAKDAKVVIDSDPADFVDWLTSRLRVQLTTGPHDSSTVPMGELGSGLQSLLDLAIHGATEVEANRTKILAIEEPESFLHPSAQRVIARRLFSKADARVLITTHSPIVVDEAAYGDVVLCHDQRFYEPNITEEDREEINTALLTGAGSEMLFAKTVLFVEGEGDRLFFEQLRRRLAAVDATGRLDQLFVVATGGKTRYAPWLKLLGSYGSGGSYPITWLAVADGDAGEDLRRALSDAGQAVPQGVANGISAIEAARANGVDEWVRSIRAFNVVSRQAEIPLALMPVDLEQAALSQCSNAFLEVLASKIGLSDFALDVVLKTLGSKGVDGQSKNGALKHPWIRGFIAKEIPWGEVNEDVRGVLRRWMVVSGMSRAAAGKLLNDPNL